MYRYFPFIYAFVVFGLHALILFLCLAKYRRLRNGIFLWLVGAQALAIYLSAEPIFVKGAGSVLHRFFYSEYSRYLNDSLRLVSVLLVLIGVTIYRQSSRS